MAYTPDDQVKDGDSVTDRSGDLVHGKDANGNAKPVDLVKDGDSAASKHGILQHGKDHSGNIKPIDLVKDGDAVSGKHGNLTLGKADDGTAKPFDLALEGDTATLKRGIPIHVKDSDGNLGFLTLQPDGTIAVSQTVPPPPSIGTGNTLRYLYGTLGSIGLSSGSTSQNVNGSTTPQTFHIDASLDYDIHILQLTVLIADGAVSHSKFGALPALINGWDLKWTESNNITFLIDKAKTTGQALVQTGFGKPFGTSNDVMIMPGYDANNDGVIINIPFSDYVPNGLRIGRGTTDKLESIINDDLTGLQDFKIYVFGYKNYPSV